jgi:hypothetical protein
MRKITMVIVAAAAMLAPLPRAHAQTNPPSAR